MASWPLLVTGFTVGLTPSSPALAFWLHGTTLHVAQGPSLLLRSRQIWTREFTWHL